MKNSSLEKFKKVTIINSNLINLITSNVKWFKKIDNPNDEKNQEFITSNSKEVYRQLKHSLEKQGSKIDALKFKTLEMKEYKKELAIKKSSKSDRIILWLSQSNNYGTNWLKPISIALGITLLAYILIIIGVSRKLSFNFNFSEESFKLTFTELGTHSCTFFQLLNPTHYLNRVFPNPSYELGVFVYFIDYLLKIMLAYLIFQTITAFRKFIK